MDELPVAQQLLPLSRLIVQEVINRLREDGLILTAGGNLQSSLEDSEERITLKTAAQMLGHGYFWLSRNYMRLGLRPSKIGGKLLFERKEVEKLLVQRKVRAVGRPRRERFAP